MLKMNENILVACMCDNNYAQHCGVMLYSLLENSSQPLDILIIENNISEQNKQKLKKITDSFESNLTFKQMNDDRINNFKSMERYGNLTTSFRIFLPEFVDDEKRLVICLDCDMVILGDIMELLNYYDDNYIFAGTRISYKTLTKTYDKLNFNPNMPYLNTGVLLINMDKYKKFNMVEKCIEFSKDNYDKLTWADMDVINGVIKGNFKEIPHEWNLCSAFFGKYHASEFYDISREELNKIMLNKKIIHFTTHKPWFYSTYHPLQYLYWFYLNQTEWKDYVYPDKNIQSLQKKLYTYVSYNLPPNLRNFLVQNGKN